MSFIPFPAYFDDAPIDLRHVFAAEKPAGKHGFLTCAEDHFEFEDGTPGRFWGTNFNGGACFPDHAHAEKTALRLAKIGCNIVRFHQLDAEWDTPNIFRFTKGPRCANTQTFDDESMDCLDYFCHCLKEQGIYLYLDICTYRRFKTEDGVACAHLLGDCGKPYACFDRRMIELQKQLAYEIWNHFNPYTGLKYKEDPAFVRGEVINECDLWAQHVTLEPYASEYRTLFGEWLKKNNISGYDAEHCDLNDMACPIQERFRIELTAGYYREMIDFMRSFGVKIPLCGTNWRVNDSLLRANLEGDYTDSHTYFYDWRWGEHRCANNPMSKSHDCGFSLLSQARVFSKPFFVSEWDMPWPNAYRAESPILYAAVGAMQNWGGFAIHTYAYGSRLERMDMLGKETSAASIGGIAYREGIFSTWNDPAKFGLFYHAALITRRGDVSCEGEKIGILGSGRAFDGASEKYRIANMIPGASGADVTVPPDRNLVAYEDGEVRSANGQLYRNWREGYGVIDSPRTKCAYGFLGAFCVKNGPLGLDGLAVDCRTDFAVVALSSLTDDALDRTDSILLSAIGRAENTDARFDGDQMLEYGHAPITAELIEADIELKTVRPNLAVWAVNAEGFYVGRLPAAYEDGVLRFRIGDLHKSIYYLIHAE